MLDLWEDRAVVHSDVGCLMANSIAEFGARAPKFSKQLARMLVRMEKAFLSALERAAATGELPEGRDPRTLARLLITVGQGLSTVGKLDITGGLVRDSISAVRALLR